MRAMTRIEVLTGQRRGAKWESAKARAERADRMYSTARSGNAHSTYHDAYTDRYDHYASAAYYRDMSDDMSDRLAASRITFTTTDDRRRRRRRCTGRSEKRFAPQSQN